MKLDTYAFIDVQNTEGTADFLGFIIEWKKLCNHLSKKYFSKGNYFYLGIEEGDGIRTTEFNDLVSDTCFVKAKIFKKYKSPDKVYPITCSNCKSEFIKRVPGKLDWKCNCDVDLTIDVIEIAQNKAIKALFFTGDGDFKPLIEKLMKDNTDSIAYIFSSPTIINKKSRLAKKLRELTSIYKNRVIFVDINLLRKIIEKNILS
jgi:uncharacterized LabA/DUF88 family protein